MLDAVNREELQGVVAHELSHVRNLDIRLMTVIAAMVGAAASDCRLDLARNADGPRRPEPATRQGRRRRCGRAAAGLWLVAVVLAPLIGQVLAMMVSRRREYLADASGAELTRNPLALASALHKIDEAAAPTLAMKRGTAHLCIADPMGRSVGLRDGGFANLMASHPPMATRIAALREMGFQAGR